LSTKPSQTLEKTGFVDKGVSSTAKNAQIARRLSRQRFPPSATWIAAGEGRQPPPTSLSASSARDSLSRGVRAGQTASKRAKAGSLPSRARRAGVDPPFSAAADKGPRPDAVSAVRATCASDFASAGTKK